MSTTIYCPRWICRVKLKPTKLKMKPIRVGNLNVGVKMNETGVIDSDIGVKMKPIEVKMKPIGVADLNVGVGMNETRVADLNAGVKMKHSE